MEKGSILAALRKMDCKGIPTAVDLVLVIDATASMVEIIEHIKQRALVMHEQIIENLQRKRRSVSGMRVKVIVFRDAYVDDVPFEESRFFNLPQENDEFRSFIENIRATGGGDEPENSLEALCLAMQSDFKPRLQNEKARHIIVMMTDASAHKLDHPGRASAPKYPQGIPEAMLDVQAMWETLDPRAKRMVLFVPDVWPWTELDSWEMVWREECVADAGIGEDIFGMFIHGIAGAV